MLIFVAEYVVITVVCFYTYIVTLYIAESYLHRFDSRNVE